MGTYIYIYIDSKSIYLTIIILRFASPCHGGPAHSASFFHSRNHGLRIDQLLRLSDVGLCNLTKNRALEGPSGPIVTISWGDDMYSVALKRLKG